jgi:hypothetical protein
MSRNDFFRKAGRFILLMVIAVIVISLGKRIVSGNDCTTCAGKGICNGKTDCNKYK